jgi:hypothetical protein
MACGLQGAVFGLFTEYAPFLREDSSPSAGGALQSGVFFGSMMLYMSFRRTEHGNDDWIRRDWWLLLAAIVLVLTLGKALVHWLGGQALGAIWVPVALSLAVLVHGRVLFGPRVPTFLWTAYAERPR